MRGMLIFFIVFSILGLLAFGSLVKQMGFKAAWIKHYYMVIAPVLIICVCGYILLTDDALDYAGGSSHRCTICGKTTGLRQITNTHGDHYWYCAEHYADAWQYYYGK